MFTRGVLNGCVIGPNSTSIAKKIMNPTLCGNPTHAKNWKWSNSRIIRHRVSLAYVETAFLMVAYQREMCVMTPKKNSHIIMDKYTVLIFLYILHGNDKIFGVCKRYMDLWANLLID
jgi:hypothetical protein